ncbi:MAG: sel1 repeat family protein [Gammaproteobacteria bacterium]|nr:sel1 repeat family protein [Gammaproteobacteria bacterium]MBU1602598.1 sel1 repeat family protein [Gammaproteobacteria bacterium]MBU2433403.1 sel1 repeat family protein [Gammaproteobacteria bacterium]MBU2451319.1 sel1 repeat family protein [Gammaproteobacteria bacterium]
MPTSILKYVDIARLVGAGLKCPVCNGTDCRHSRWLSKAEKLGSEGFRPYRCNDCAHRFLARNSASLERILINCTAVAMLCFGIWLGVDLWLASVDQPKSALSPANAAVPATPAQKQQEAADSGDAAAMLQLGRDLATGNKRPQDVGEAAKWVQLAAATGNPEAMLELGRFYRDGVGVAQDSARAYVWLSRAAAAKQTEAVLEREALVRTMGEAPLKVALELSMPTQPAAALIRPK